MGYLSSSERTLRNLASFLLVFSFIAAVNSVIDIYYRKDDSQDIHKLLSINTVVYHSDLKKWGDLKNSLVLLGVTLL